MLFRGKPEHLRTLQKTCQGIIQEREILIETTTGIIGDPNFKDTQSSQGDPGRKVHGDQGLRQQREGLTL